MFTFRYMVPNEWITAALKRRKRQHTSPEKDVVENFKKKKEKEKDAPKQDLRDIYMPSRQEDLKSVCSNSFLKSVFTVCLCNFSFLCHLLHAHFLCLSIFSRFLLASGGL